MSITPFDPGVVPSGGYSTNTLSSAAGAYQAPQEPGLFAGYHHDTSYVPSSGGKFASEIGNPVQPGHSETTRTPVYMTQTQFLDGFDQLDREDFLHFRNLLIAAGLVGAGASAADVRDAYAQVLSRVTDMQAGGIQVSPMGLIKNLVRLNGIDPKKVGNNPNYHLESDDPNSQDFTGTKVQKDRQVTDITEGQAWSSLQNSLSAMLGRDPSDQEVRDFTYRMNQLAAQNPAISKTITRYKAGENIGSTQHVDPGFTADDMNKEAYDQAQNAPDYAEYRGASYLFNAVMGALGPIGG